MSNREILKEIECYVCKHYLYNHPTVFRKGDFMRQKCQVKGCNCILEGD